jgi:hypothetical protein
MNYHGITIHKPTGLYRVVLPTKHGWKHFGLYPTMADAMKIIRQRGGYHGKLF